MQCRFYQIKPAVVIVRIQLLVSRRHAHISVLNHFTLNGIPVTLCSLTPWDLYTPEQRFCFPYLFVWLLRCILNISVRYLYLKIRMIYMQSWTFWLFFEIRDRAAGESLLAGAQWYVRWDSLRLPSIPPHPCLPSSGTLCLVYLSSVPVLPQTNHFTQCSTFS